MDFGLDLHCQMILDEYRDNHETFEILKELVVGTLKRCLTENNILVTAVEARIKTEKSLAGKLELKGNKYKTLSDITDILGARVITFYSDEVDKIAALVEKCFNVDWDNSVDKRKMLKMDQFGYMSLHYICSIPPELYSDPLHPEVNEYRFEIQMRTTLQHAWANMYHDTGYKSGVEVPPEYLRNLNRLAGMLELADEQFSRIRKEINDYRREVQALVASGNFEEVPLNGDTFRSYLDLNPFKNLAEKIATINQAELYPDNLMPYYDALIKLQFQTIGDIEKMRVEYSEGAYQLALHQLSGTDLDIVALSVALQNLCIVYILHQDMGEKGLVFFFEQIYGHSDYNLQRAKRIMEQARKINLI